MTKADINGRDNTGMTPVMWACFYDSTEHLERMITLGADLTLVDVEGVIFCLLASITHRSYALVLLVVSH